MKNIQQLALIGVALTGLISCNRSKPKPISNDITKMTVSVNGKKDSVINNAEKNYGNATVSEPCVKCLIGIIQQTEKYKTLVTSIPLHDIIYEINWITSSTPKDMGNGKKIINGMQIAVDNKAGGTRKNITTYLYDNENGQFYLSNSQNSYGADTKVDSASLKKIRNSCFWGVASAK